VCTTCGCGIPADDHGDKENLTVKRVQRAASAAGLPLPEAAWNIPRAIRDAVTPGEPLIPRTTTLAWDVDGVLAFAAEALASAVNAHFGTRWTVDDETFFPGTLIASRLPPEQRGWVEELVRDPIFMESMAPDWHALDTLADAYHAGYPSIVLTARHPDLRKITADWLAGWGCPLPAENVYAVGHDNKPPWLAQRYGPDRPAALIDDNPAVPVTVARPGAEVWLPARPYNDRPMRPYAHRFTSWPQLRHVLGLGPQP
jgi:hypothetical protein